MVTVSQGNTEINFEYSEINLKYIISPYNVFSFTNYCKEQHFKLRHLILVLKNVFVRI